LHTFEFVLLYLAVIVSSCRMSSVVRYYNIALLFLLLLSWCATPVNQNELYALMIEVSYMFCILFLRLLKEAADDDHYRKRFHLMFGGLLSIVGEKMRSELSKQEDFVRVLSSIADKVKTGRDKEVCNNFILSN